MASTLLIMALMGVSIIFPLINSPLPLGLTLLTLSLIVALISLLMALTWFSLIMFIIFIGGLLVMFAYIAVMTPNTMMASKNLIAVQALTLTAMTILLNLQSTPPNTSTLTRSPLTNNLNAGTQVADTANSPLLILHGAILLSVLIAVASLCQSFKSPLRPFSPM
uniref:NADH dehydrogenase subunit 6 n=1 Tax=Brachiopoda sp. TaxID=3230945 RepID=A0AAU8HQE4_9BILA